jgi:translation initiation factor IF-3
MLSRVIESINESGTLEREPQIEGRNMVAILAPKKTS